MSSKASTTAQAPFNIRSADVLLRTSDNVDFYLYKVILSLASPFFNDMFSITQPEASTASTIPSSIHDAIPVTETSQTFDCLMRLCYPVDDPVIEDLSDLENVLEAAIKYQMSEAKKLCRTMLRTFVQARPLDVYAISCRLHVEEEAQLAAEAWKAASSFMGYNTQFEKTLEAASFGSKMGVTTAGSYYRLLHYLRPPAGAKPMVNFTDGGDPEGGPTITAASQSPHKAVKPLHDTTKTDAILTSQDGVEFPVHSAILYAASAAELLDHSLAKLQQDVKCDSESSRPTIPVDLPSDVLAELLRLCYPIERFNLANLSLLCSIYAAAEKWRITRITLAIKNEFNTLIDQHPNPVSLYFIAVKQGWRAEAEHAARVIARKGVQRLYAREMEDSRAAAYHHLLRFCHDFSSRAQTQLSGLTPSYKPPQGSPPAMESFTYAIIANEVNRISSHIESNPPRCFHGYTYGNCSDTSFCKSPKALLKVTSTQDLLERNKLWEKKYAELLSEVKLRFELAEKPRVSAWSCSVVNNDA